jgi:hypothetical protein
MSTPEIAREPGWYNHPGDPIRTERWWDGLAWTDLTRDVEPERIFVNGEERTVMSFAAKHRPIAAINPKRLTQAAQVLPAGEPRTDGDDMAIPGDLAIHQTRRGEKKNNVTFRAKSMAGPINPKLLPPEPRSANPKSIVGTVKSKRDVDDAPASRSRRSYDRDALTTRVVMSVTLAALAVGLIAVASPRLNTSNDQVESAFDPLFAAQAPEIPDFSPAETRLGEVVEVTNTIEGDEASENAQSREPKTLPVLVPGPSSNVFVNDDQTFTMLIASNWTPSASQTAVGNAKFQTSTASGLLPDTLSVAVVMRQPADSDSSVLELQQAQARAINPDVQPLPLSDDGAVVLFDLSSGSGTAQTLQAVVLGSAHYAVINWTSFDAPQFAADKQRVRELMASAATT